MKPRKKTILKRMTYALLILSIPFSGVHNDSAHAQESLRIAAVVNDEIISAYDLQARLKMIVLMSRLPKTQETLQSLTPATLRNLIDEKLRLQEAENLGITVSQADLDNALSVVESRNRLKPNTLIGILANNSIDPETLFQQLRSEISWSRIIARKHRNRVTITEEEIDKALRAEEEARNQPRYRLSEIVVTVESPEDLPQVTKQVTNLEAQLRAGADFGSMARSFSNSPSASRSGDIGWLRRDQIPIEVRSDVIALQPGQISKPIRVTTGFVIFKLHQIKSGADVPKPDAQLKLSQFHLSLPADAPTDTVNSYVKTARELTQAVSGCESFDKVGEESGSPLSGGMGEISLLKLPPALQNAISALPVGKASTPIRSGDSVIVLMVCERKDIPAPDTSVNRDDIEFRLLNERLAVYARQEIRELRRAAYIEIR